MSMLNSNWLKDNVALIFFLSVEFLALVLSIAWLIYITVKG